MINYAYKRAKNETNTAQKLKFNIKDFFSKCEQIRWKCGFGHIYWRNPQKKTWFFVERN